MLIPKEEGREDNFSKRFWSMVELLKISGIDHIFLSIFINIFVRYFSFCLAMKPLKIIGL